ncbi:hypothetical protein CCACVL1_08345 [Corchorus capsularis]|uniref:Uncharacterized protein n=1 Tax=Corchorus capsularis TaxID=210143 RepID=A0A1R3J0Y9_COCAP|nr:hypothetical protein CCACVL1_08345 [Corchorus capsularis]
MVQEGTGLLSFHCSVKPASRCAFLSRIHETQGLGSSPSAQLLAWNGQARNQPLEPDPYRLSQCPITILPPLGGNRVFFRTVSCKLFDNLAKLKLSFTNKR